MDCPACRKRNRDDARFCSDCGAPFAPRCAACGSELLPESRFCDRCGVARGSGFGGRGSAEAPGPRPPAPDPRSYTPKHLAERILQSRSALEGERKQVTVLFADVQGSMELAEQVDPEEWHRIMDGFFAILSEGVHRFEGTINQYTGDGIMALFGAPVALEDHASRACHAALYLTDELRRYAQELKRERGLRFSVRMGLNSGEVVVGKIGDDLRMDYTAQGATVGLAARMEQLADPGKVYLTEHTEALVRGFFELEELGAFTIKGVHRPVQAYALLGIGPLRSRLEISQRRGFSPFLGRDEEMAELERALQAAAEGRRRIVRIVGEAGIGKSRLCYEFARSCRARGIEVHEATAVSHGRNIPLLPVLQLFRSLFGIGENDADEEARRKIAGTLVLLDDHLKDLLPAVFDFLGVPDRQHAPSGTVENKQQQLVDLAGRLIVSRSLSRPLAILIEDLHWLDEGSEAFLKHLLARSEGARALFLLNHRPEYDAARLEAAAVPPLILHPFGPETTEALLRGLLGGDASLAPLHGRLHDHAGGNPFFIEEIVRELEQSGKLAGVRGAYLLVKPVEDVVLPATVQAVLAARMDRLSEPEKGTLQTAAVIGKTFSEGVLSKVMAAVDGVADAPDVSAAIRGLTEAEFLWSSQPQSLEYAFKHPLTQEVAYQTQLSDRRRRVHGAVATTLIELDADRLDERAALLAHHWEMADRLWEAAQWNRRAAGWASGRDNAGALWHLRKVLDLLERIPATRDAAALSISTREGILRLGPFVDLPAEEAERVLDEGRKVAGHAGDGASLVHLVSSYGYYRMMTGEMEEAHRYAQEAASLAQACGDQAAQARISLDDAQAAIWTGRLREGLSIAESALSAHRRGDSPLRGFSVGLAGEAFLLALRGLCLSFMGRAREGARDLESAIAGARYDGAPEGLLVAHLFRAFGANVAQDTDEAILHARTALEIALRLQHRFFEPLAVAMLGIAQVFAGRWQEGKRTLEDLLAGDLGGMGILFEPFVLTSLSLAHLESGDVDRARDGAARSLVLAIERGVKTGECIAQIGVARVSLEIDGVAARATVQHALERAAELIEETGAYSFAPWVHIERAALAFALGDLPGRQRELERAIELAETMGVQPYTPELKAE